MRLLTLLLLAIFAVTPAFAQVPTPMAPSVKDKDKSTEKPKVEKPVKLPPSPLDKVEGYKRHLIEGFTVMMSTEAGEGEIKDAELKPMDVLALEFQIMKKVMPSKQIELLQKITIWAEWDDFQSVGNGRDGRALATYYGGSQLSLLNEKKNPFKSKCVTIHSLKILTEQHQPKVETQSLVVLHEFAHAVHDQLLGFDHDGVKAAYRQAMERKLYDKAQYVSTNEAEFFAELTCAYYDQLQHYPKTREELKKHDPATYKLLESVWGSAKKSVKAAAGTTKSKTLVELNGSAKFDLKVSLADIAFGPTIHGPEFKVEDANDTVLILSNFGGDELLVLEKLAKIHEELAPYGAKVVVAYSFVAEPDVVKKKLEERNVLFTGLGKALFAQKDGQSRSEKPGHTLIFSPDGKCVFRGSGYDALPHARAAVIKMLVAKLVKSEVPKVLVPVLEALSQGSVPLLEAVPKLTPHVTAADPEVAAVAKALVTAILAPAQIQLTEAQSKLKSDPLGAFLIAEKIPQIYKGTPFAAKGAALAEQLKQHPDVAKELKARKLFEPIRKGDVYLMAQAGSFSPLDEKFQRENASGIQQLIDIYSELKKKHPLSRATDDAAKIVAKYRTGD